MVDCRRSRGDLRSARDPLRASDRVRAELCHHAGLGETTGAFIRPTERFARSLKNQYGGFRQRQHLVCHTAD